MQRSAGNPWLSCPGLEGSELPWWPGGDPHNLKQAVLMLTMISVYQFDNGLTVFGANSLTLLILVLQISKLSNYLFFQWFLSLWSPLQTFELYGSLFSILWYRGKIVIAFVHNYRAKITCLSLSGSQRSLCWLERIKQGFFSSPFS